MLRQNFTYDIGSRTVRTLAGVLGGAKDGTSWALQISWRSIVHAPASWASVRKVLNEPQAIVG